MERERFTLTREQIDFLREKYSQVEIVQKMLSVDKNRAFTVDLEDLTDFYDWLTDESVNTTVGMDYDPTDDTYMIQGIIDSICYQLEENRRSEERLRAEEEKWRAKNSK